jgi:hypothetical protein
MIMELMRTKGITVSTRITRVYLRKITNKTKCFESYFKNPFPYRSRRATIFSAFQSGRVVFIAVRITCIGIVDLTSIAYFSREPHTNLCNKNVHLYATCKYLKLHTVTSII